MHGLMKTTGGLPWESARRISGSPCELSYGLIVPSWPGALAEPAIAFNADK